MTIPTLHQNITEKVTVTSLKKAYSAFQQAYLLNAAENPDNYEVKNILSKLRAVEYCTPEQTGCLTTENYKNFNGNIWAGAVSATYRAKLADGTLFRGYNYSNCTTNYGSSKALQSICGEVNIDINGDKKPNQVGKDFFFFYVTKYGIIPFGSAEDISGHPFSGCLAKNDGYSCTAWAVYNGNTDYLKCSDLSWNGKKKCK